MPESLTFWIAVRSSVTLTWLNVPYTSSLAVMRDSDIALAMRAKLQCFHPFALVVSCAIIIPPLKL